MSISLQSLGGLGLVALSGFLLLGVATISAEDKPQPAGDKQAAIDAYAAFCKVRDPWDKARRPLLHENEEIGEALVEDGLTKDRLAELRARREAVNKGMNELNDAEKQMRELRGTFIKAFNKLSWEEWSVTENAALLDDALMLLITETAREEREAVTIRATEFLLEKMPECRCVGALVSRLYPLAIMSKAEREKTPELVLERLTYAQKKVGAIGQPGAKMWLAEYYARNGDAAKAAKFNQEAWDEIPAERKDGDPRGAVRELVEMRMRLVGKSMPELHYAQWLGENGKPLPDLKGRIVVLHFFNTANPAARQNIGELDKIVAEYAEKISVIGVSRREVNGALPPSKEELASDKAKSWRAESGSDAEYLEHLKAFREVAKPSYPWAVISNADYKACGVHTLHAFAVIDASGTVVYARLGGDVKLLRASIELALKNAPSSK